MRIILGLILLSLISCQKQSKTTIDLVKEWQGKEIILPQQTTLTSISDELVYKGLQTQYKILTYVDPQGCMACKLKLKKWKNFISKVDSLSGKSVEFLFFFCLIYIFSSIFLLKFQKAVSFKRKPVIRHKWKKHL